MSTQVCPYLCSVDDPSKYFSTPDAANGCYAVSSGRPADIPLDFQQSACLGGQYELCSRYKAAGRLQTRRQGRRLLAVGSLAALLLAGCALVAVLSLILGGLGATQLSFLARDTDTPQPTATPSPTWTPTTTPTPTELPTNTATATPQPLPPTATASLVDSTEVEFVSPMATPTWPPTAAWLPPTATRPRPTAVRRVYPTATYRAYPTATRGPTVTPWPTYTRMPTSTPIIVCYSGDTMTFTPATPVIGEPFSIEVHSYTGYTDVSLIGGVNPQYKGISKVGGYTWKWEDLVSAGGAYTYSFKIKSGALTCVTKTVTAAGPTATPIPSYDVGLTLNGVDFKPIFTDTQPVEFGLSLTNSGNTTDTIQVGLDAALPNGWTAEYCIGGSCSDHSVANMPVTLPSGGSQALSIKLVAAANAQGGDTLSPTLWVQSVGDPTKRKTQSVTVVVTKPGAP